MPLYMDVHKKVKGANAKAVADAHKKDLQHQRKYKVKYLKYWYDPRTTTVFCLVDAPDKETAAKVHKEAHGLLADEIHGVLEG